MFDFFFYVVTEINIAMIYFTVETLMKRDTEVCEILITDSKI